MRLCLASRTPRLCLCSRIGGQHAFSAATSTRGPSLPFLSIKDAIFYETPIHSQRRAPLFPNLNLEIDPKDKLAIIGPPSPKTLFLRILAGGLFPDPPNGVHFPLFASQNRDPREHVRLVEFAGVGGGAGLLGSRVNAGYYGARFESFHEEGEDVTVKEWIGGSVKGLGIEKLEDRRVLGLSNGEARRVRLAREVILGGTGGGLLVDEPFVGLDPIARETVSSFLNALPDQEDYRTVMLGLRKSEPVPEWVSHVVELDSSNKVTYNGPKATHTPAVCQQKSQSVRAEKIDTPTSPPLISLRSLTLPHPSPGLPPLISDLNLDLHANTAIRITGPNGTGKSTLFSVLTSDHPATYSQAVTHFGRPRLPEPGRPGTPLEVVQREIGLVGPELHAVVPRMRGGKELTAEQILLTGFGPDRGAGSFVLCRPPLEAHSEQLYSKMKKHFAEIQLEENLTRPFRELSASMQRVVLLLRATAYQPKVLLLDEAFSGMDGLTKKLCYSWLSEEWKRSEGVMVVVSHFEEEVPVGDWRWRVLKLEGDGEWSLE